MQPTLIHVLGLAIASSTVAYAESSPALENTLVTATRTEESYASTLASVTLFNRDDIEKFQVQSLPELLTKAAGVSLTSNGGRGAVASISLRGNQSDHTLILINGVRVSSATLGSTRLELIDPEQIERIEIVRGPKSSLYGSDALGGVINIITRRASDERPVTLKVSAGNHDTREAVLTAGHRGDYFSASLTASTVSTDGIDNTESTDDPHGDDDALEQDTAGIDLAFTPTKAFRLGINYQYSDSETDYDADCYTPSYMPVACTPYATTRADIAQVTARLSLGNVWTTSVTGGYSKNESEELARDIDIDNTINGGLFITERSDGIWQNDFQLTESLLFTAGFEYLHERVGGSTDYSVDERDNKAVYLQWQWSVGGFAGHFGARNDDNDQFGDHDTYTATLSYQFFDAFKVIASYGEAFKAPTFNDLYYPNFGDPTMIPEESDSFELSFQGLTDSVDWSVRGYRNNVENLIQYNSATFRNDQISSATIDGLEFALGLNVLEWEINGALTLLDAEDDASGNELARRPKKVFNLDLDRRFDDWSVGATLYASGRRYEDAANTEKLSGYATVALRGAYYPSEQWALRLKADNIFEKNYFLASSYGLGRYRQPGLEVLFSVVYTPSF